MLKLNFLIMDLYIDWQILDIQLSLHCSTAKAPFRGGSFQFCSYFIAFSNDLYIMGRYGAVSLSPSVQLLIQIIYSRFRHYNWMSERKPWTKQEDDLLRRLVLANEIKQDKLKWAGIAQQLGDGRSRTGKQCRERWHNQLKPGIDNQRDWTPQEEEVLFRVQEQMGNRWAAIAKELPGRTDNNIKNYFYSTLRKALRKVNTYVQFHKRETHYRNIKEFKQQTLSKILSVAEKKYENKINLRNEGVEYDARQIKRKLVEIQRDDKIVASSDRNEQLEEAVEMILEFNRNCKRRKGKRKEQDEQEEDSQDIDFEEPTQKPTQKNKQKRQKKERIDTRHEITEEIIKTVPVATRKQSSNINSSQNVSEAKRLSSSSHFNNGSSQLFNSSPFRNYQAGSGSGSGSQNYAPPLFESRYYMGNEPQQQTFLSGIRNLQRRETIKSNQPLDLWQEQPMNIPINTFNLDWSQNFMAPQDNQLRMSTNLDASCLFTRRASSRIERRNSDKS